MQKFVFVEINIASVVEISNNIKNVYEEYSAKALIFSKPWQAIYGYVYIKGYKND